MSFVDHQPAQQVSKYINGQPVTSQYDECVRFHVNGYHHRKYVQESNGWDNKTWESKDFYTFGKHFKRLRPSHRSKHFKFIHDYLPLGDRRFREAPVKDSTLKLCPCCRTEDETPSHFLRCPSNPTLKTSLDTMRSDVNNDTHPVRYLLADGICHVLQSDAPFSPSLSQFPHRFHEPALEVLNAQQSIGWGNLLKGYLAKQWSLMSQYEMFRDVRDQHKGEARMMQIMVAITSHVRRLWLSRNSVLHSNTTTMEVNFSAEVAEIQYYHSRPHLLRTGDQHYCARPLSKILASSPSTRRWWLRKVKQSSADLTKDGTTQTLISTYFSSI
jgi:hypothetical protein